ncbi:NAD(P)/FAD-dependent oxidoreductase [Pseudonocardia ailaonensis]|uniref:NAD(P)/FAD-dependent oxidoreductase n=1 Tax=Pseudonocardia ailaonensis TaxID=367279 RepID=A0ABN2N0I8_9PSEU
MTQKTQASRLDAIVIGAGFGGLYALYELRRQGFDVLLLERAPGVGGTWYWNCYPGARVDVYGIEYSYSFSDEIQQEWDWSEVMPTQPELERYLNFVTDRLDLRRDIRFSTTVTAARFDEEAGVWSVEADTGERFTAQFVVAATGCLSAPLAPNIRGVEAFSGDTLITSTFPREGYDFRGKRVAVVGTGSSGVQAIPIVAEQASSLHVFQRSAAFTRPAGNRPMGRDEMDAIKASYPDLRRRLAETFTGTIHVGAITVEDIPTDERILTASPEKIRRKVAEDGWSAPWGWYDAFVDPAANKAAVALYGDLVRGVVQDPDVAESLVPTYPLGCKRPIYDTGYFATFNRDNVTLVDLRKEPIDRVTPDGIETAAQKYNFDVIVYATGFDAITGALTRIDIRGRDDVSLKARWLDDARAYLGLQSHGFPNLFMVNGPGSPSVHINVVAAVEHHVQIIADLMVHMAKNDKTTVEPDVEAEIGWAERVDSLVTGTIRASDDCNSWYLGSNVAGKRRKYLTFVGGQVAYRQACDELVNGGYIGFVFD